MSKLCKLCNGFSSFTTEERSEMKRTFIYETVFHRNEENYRKKDCAVLRRRQKVESKVVEGRNNNIKHPNNLHK